MLQVCNDGHADIAYECDNCPLCESIEDCYDLESDYQNLKDDYDRDVNELKARIEELDFQLQDKD